MTEQFIVLDLSALITGGQVAVGPMSLIEAALWNEGRVGTMVVPLQDPTVPIEPTPDDIVQMAIREVQKTYPGQASARKIQVIKEVRTLTQAGLKEAKDMVDSYFQRHPTI